MFGMGTSSAPILAVLGTLPGAGRSRAAERHHQSDASREHQLRLRQHPLRRVEWPRSRDLDSRSGMSLMDFA